MKLIKDIKFVATPAKIFMTVLILLIALSILQAFTIQTTREFTRSRQSAAKEPKAKLTPEEERIKRIESSVKEFSPDGTIYLVHRQRQYRADRYFESEQIYDANGNLLRKGPIDTRPNEYLSWAGRLYGRDSFAYHRVDFTLQHLKQTQTITPGFSQNIEIPVCSGDKTRQVWRYQPVRGIFIGYHFKGGLIGYIGSAGFTESKSKAKPFGKFRVFNAWCPLDSYSPTLLWQTQRRIYQIDFEKQHVELIFESTDSDIEIDRTSLHAWRDLKPGEKEYVDHEKYRPLLLCVTEDGKHHLILREPERQFSLAVPRSSATATKQDIFVYRFGSDAFPPADIVRSRELYDKWLRETSQAPMQPLWRVWTRHGPLVRQLLHALVKRRIIEQRIVIGRDYHESHRPFVRSFHPS